MERRKLYYITVFIKRIYTIFRNTIYTNLIKWENIAIIIKNSSTFDFLFVLSLE